MSKYIISLSTIPPRFDQLGPTLDSLLAQTVPPEKVLLYIPRSYKRFPEYDGHLPKVPEGVEIRITDTDFGPASKVLPAVQEFRDAGVDIFFGDDDQIYPPFLVERMLAARAHKPDACIAVCGALFVASEGKKRSFAHTPRWVRKWRITDVPYQLRYFVEWSVTKARGQHFTQPPRNSTLRPGYADGFEGYLGALVRPHFFPEACFDVPEFAFPVDDIWLSGHLTYAGHPTWVIGGRKEPLLEARVTDYGFNEHALFLSLFGGKDRYQIEDIVVQYFRDTFGIWR